MKLVINGQVPSLKNNQKVTRNGKFYTDPKVKDYMKNAIAQLKDQWKNEPLKTAENITMVFYYDSNRTRDLSNSVDTVFDVLKVVVVDDDNFKCIPRFQVEFGGVSKNPRTEIWVDF